MKNSSEPLPFSLIKQMPPKTWVMCESCMELKSEMQWDDHCVLPIAGGMAVAQELGWKKADGYKISALYSWRKYKEIYSFDDDLAALLMEQADDETNIPISILLQLPFPCIFIQYGTTGFFAYFEHDVNNKQFEFRIWLLEDETMGGYPIILHIEEQCTVAESLQRTVEETKAHAPEGLLSLLNNDHEANMLLRSYPEIINSKAAQLLQLVLYICADNSEIEEDPEQKTFTRRTKDSEHHPKDVFREIKKWDVGYRIGNQIRRYKSTDKVEDNFPADEQASASYKKGSRKAPHARRGHWHHFWVGKMDSDERRLILKWVAPMFINGDEDDNIATIHPVRGN